MATNTGVRYFSAESMVLQPDGKIVVGGEMKDDFGLARYHADGTPDLSFGDNGIVSTDYDNSLDRLFCIALQADGKIVSFGYGGKDIFDHILMRHMPDGSLDTAFGEEGKVLTSTEKGLHYDGEIVILPDGKILLGSTVDYIDFDVREDQDFEFVRYMPDGRIDSTFGTYGKVTTDFDHFSDEAVKAMVVLPDGKFIAAGYTDNHNGEDDNFGMARYHADGLLDTTFGIKGITTTHFVGFDLCNDITVQPDGKIILVGYSNYPTRFAIARYDENGNLDDSFGDEGKVLLSFNSGYNVAETVLVDPDGNIVVSGSSSQPEYYDFAMTRLKPDGTLDDDFGNGGKVLTDFGTQSASNDMILQSDNKIVLAGIVYNILFDSIMNNNDTILIALARYHLDTLLGHHEITRLDSEVKLFPNPAQEESVLSFTLNASAFLSLSLYNAAGRKLTNYFIHQQYSSGVHTYPIDIPASIGPGIYFLELIVGKEQRIVKLLVR